MDSPIVFATDFFVYAYYAYYTTDPFDCKYLKTSKGMYVSKKQM